MRIALCSKGNFSLEKGFTKNRIELAESLEKLGWETTLVDKQLLGIPNSERYNPEKHSNALKDYLIKNIDHYDVVLYEYDTLPFRRGLFDKHTLMIARPAILAYHFDLIPFRYDLKSKISNFIRSCKLWFGKERNVLKEELRKVDYCLRQADIIQVQNKKDQALLVSKGFAEKRIIIVPNGIPLGKIGAFNRNSFDLHTPFIVAYVGTFDFRKGAMDFPKIFKQLRKEFPDVKLKLLGTQGMFQTTEEVLNFFPKKYHAAIDVLPKFKADELPMLLKDCHIGIFPSYLESFGFGALEMMCAGLPVVAYDIPGPSDFVPKEMLAPRGDVRTFSNIAISTLKDSHLLYKRSHEAREIVLNKYCWDDIARKVDAQYKFYLNQLQEKPEVREPSFELKGFQNN